MDSIKKCISEIRILAETMLKKSISDSKISYDKVNSYIEDLELYNKLDFNDDGSIGEKLGKLRWHAGALAGLDDDNGHSDQQHYMWLLTVLDILSGKDLFNIKKN